MGSRHATSRAPLLPLRLLRRLFRLLLLLLLLLHQHLLLGGNEFFIKLAFAY